MFLVISNTDLTTHVNSTSNYIFDIWYDYDTYRRVGKVVTKPKGYQIQNIA